MLFRSSRTAILTTKVLITTKVSRVQRPKSNKLRNLQFPRILVESTNRCTNGMARTQEVLKSFSLKFQQSNKCLWGNKRGRTKEEMHQELQDQDLLGSPHLEKRWIGGIVDLDLLSQIPQRYTRITRGIKRGTSFSKVNNGGEREKNVLGKAS